MSDRRTAPEFECERCGHCCRTIRVPLTEADLRRLTGASRLAAEQIVEWCAPNEIDMEGEPETFAHVREGRRIMVLSHVNGACRFLQDERCSVYPHRPTACAAFPFFVEADGSAIGRLPGPCEPTSVPNPGHVRQVSATLSCELESHAWRVHAWNRRQRRRLRLHRPAESQSQFLEHLGFGR